VRNATPAEVTTIVLEHVSELRVTSVGFPSACASLAAQILSRLSAEWHAVPGAGGQLRRCMTAVCQKLCGSNTVMQSMTSTLRVQVERRACAQRSPSKRRPRQSIAAIEQPTDAATAAQALSADGAAPARPTDAALLSVTDGMSGSAADGSHVTLESAAHEVIAADAAGSHAGGPDEDSRQGADAEPQQSAPMAALPQPSVRAEDSGARDGSGVDSVAGTDGNGGVSGDGGQLEATAGQVSTMMEQMIQHVDATQSSVFAADHPDLDSQLTTSELSAEKPAAGCAETSAGQADAAVVAPEPPEQAAEHSMASSAEASALDQQTGSDAPSAAERTDKDTTAEHIAVIRTNPADCNADAARQTSGDAAEDSAAVSAPSASEPAGTDGADMHATAAMDRWDMRCSHCPWLCTHETVTQTRRCLHALVGDCATAVAEPSDAAVSCKQVAHLPCALC